jgi:carbon monoxide dehydrogenase subunit G
VARARTEPRGRLSVPSFSHTVTIPRPPAEVFPWLLEADRVTRWTSGVERYEPAGPIARGTRIAQTLEVSGHREDLEAEVTRHEPPTAAEVRFSLRGIEVVRGYSLAEQDGGTRLTETVDAEARGLTARLLLPAVQPRLERKQAEDLERLRQLLVSA